jgi:hypothetical protein
LRYDHGVMGFLCASVLAVAAASPPRHFDVAAAFVAPKVPGGVGAVSVLFSPTDPDVHVNQEPAPRLKLEAGQVVLVDRQAPTSAPAREADFDPEKARYLDLAKPVRFPVAISPKAPKGEQELAAKVVYFYCSKREGWCRRGTAPVEFTVEVP